MNIKKFFSTGMWVMRKMRFATKLTLLALVLLLPLAVMLAQLIAGQTRTLELTRSELQGISLVEETSTLIRQLQVHRGQTNMVLSGNAAAVAARNTTRDSLKQARDALDRDLMASMATLSQAEWLPLRNRVDGLVAALEGKTGPASFALHTALIEELGRFVYGLAKQSNLLFDADPATYLLIDMVVSRTIPWTEQLGTLRGQGAGLLSQPVLDEAGSVRMLSQLAALDQLGRDLQYSIRLISSYGLSDPSAEAALQASTEFSERARVRFEAGAITGEPQLFFTMGTQAIAAVTAYQRATVASSKQLLQDRYDSDLRLFWLITLGSSVCILLMLYFLLSFHLSFMIDLRQLLDLMQETAKGNLRQRVSLRGTDELYEISSALDTMVNNLSAMVASVRSNSALVSYAGSSLATGNRALSSRTEQQAANLEQTAASVQELSSTVQGNAQAAQQSDIMASGVRDVAENGARTMTEAIASIEAIQASTKRMDEIVGVIDGLAFQTNILALNAAVEAARAGESGRGFAVVASEVRLLAQRSAASAKEIRQLIGASSVQVATGVTQIRRAGTNITQIVEGIRGVAANMSQISISSAEQSASLTEITTAVRQLDEITQQNASVVERGVNQANDLEVRASTLAEAVAGFQLMQGTAEEAMAMVDRAMVYRSQAGSRENFLRDLTQPENAFFERDMYIFALDRNGTYLAFGGNRSKVGTRVQDIAGIDGAGLLDAILTQAAQEPGWVEYDILNPSTGRIQTKMSFVQQVDDVYIGCGIYKNLVTG
ncbi:MAG: methyl-accepting chemotaxis protein [Rhodoferax sp.]|jgi:methyl-accepting chemotaxis protein